MSSDEATKGYLMSRDEALKVLHTFVDDARYFGATTPLGNAVERILMDTMDERRFLSRLKHHNEYITELVNRLEKETNNEQSKS